MQRFGLLTLLAVLACEPAPPTTSDASSAGMSSAGSESSSGEDISTGDTAEGSTSTDGDTPTEGGEACACVPASPEFCGAVVDLCKSVGLNFPHPDFCAAYAKWCAEGTSGDTCSTCTFLQATCDDFAPEPAGCAGLYDTCSCLP